MAYTVWPLFFETRSKIYKNSHQSDFKKQIKYIIVGNVGNNNIKEVFRNDFLSLLYKNLFVYRQKQEWSFVTLRKMISISLQTYLQSSKSFVLYLANLLLQKCQKGEIEFIEIR